MKNRILFSLVVAVIPFFSFAQIDDMYFVPQKETKEQKEQQTRSQPSMHAISESVATTASNEHVQNNARDVDEYNRRYRWENDSTAANEEETANEENARADSIQGLEEDYQYTKRILRFNTPTIGVAVSSPLYWDLRYGPNSIYWDVYDDGFYAYAYPSSWYWGPTFSYSWGWGSYNPFWGWGGPWYAGWYDPWYWGPHWHHPHWGHPGHGWYPSRPVTRPSVRYRENSTLARGTSRTNVRNSSSARRAIRNTGNTNRQTISENSARFTPNRSSTTTRQSPRTRTTSTPQRNTQPSRSSNFTPSTTRSTFRPSVSSPSRSGGGFSPSRGGGARGGRR